MIYELDDMIHYANERGASDVFIKGNSCRRSRQRPYCGD